MVNESLEEVIFDGIRFLESLTRHYGAEQGMAVWEKMGEAVGDKVKERERTKKLKDAKDKLYSTMTKEELKILGIKI